MTFYWCLKLLEKLKGGNDVFVDIGDKAWGVRCCQRFFGGILSAQSLHVGDQFLSAGANDFKVCPVLSFSFSFPFDHTPHFFDVIDDGLFFLFPACLGWILEISEETPSFLKTRKTKE